MTKNELLSKLKDVKTMTDKAFFSVDEIIKWLEELESEKSVDYDLLYSKLCSDFDDNSIEMVNDYELDLTSTNEVVLVDVSWNMTYIIDTIKFWINDQLNEK